MALVPLMRGILAGGQATPLTAAASLTSLRWITDCKIVDDIKHDVPEFLNYRTWMEVQAIPLTRMCTWEIQGYLDTSQFGLFLLPLSGTPASGVFKMGGFPPILLTLAQVNYNLTTFKQVTDAITTEIQLQVSATAAWKFTVKGVGVLSVPQASPPTYTLTAAADKSPVHPGWTVVTRDTVASGLLSATITIKAKVEPLFETPLAAPADTDPEGLSPSDWEINGVSGEYDFIRKYTAYSGSDIADYHTATPRAWVFNIKDPHTAGTPGVVITIPVGRITEGEEDPSKARPRAHVKGHMLYDATAATGLSFTLTGSGQSYTAT